MTSTVPPSTCGSCGAELGPGALFCLGCGTAVPREQRRPTRSEGARAWYEVADEPAVQPGPAAERAPEPIPEPDRGPQPEPEPESHPGPEPEPPGGRIGVAGVPYREARLYDVVPPPKSPSDVPAHDITVAPSDPAERIDPLDGPERPAAFLPGRWRDATDQAALTPERPSVGVPGRTVLVIAVVVVVAVAGVLFWLLQSGSDDAREEAVAAWRAGNAAWSRGEIETVCDRYDAIGDGGMWQDRATCVKAEQAGYDQAGRAQRDSLAAMTIDPARADVVDEDTVVIWYRDARANGQRPPYFTDTDLAVIHRLDGQGWRQVGVRYGTDVVGSVPQAVLQSVPPATASPSAG